jgi:hypothetical protein
MLWLPVYDVVPGSVRVYDVRATWIETRDYASGRYLWTAETTPVYWAVQDREPGAIAVDACLLPRDDTMLLECDGKSPVWHWIPAGGTLRVVQLRS